MKKNRTYGLMEDIGLLKMIKIMRIVVFLLFLSLSQVFAVDSYSQQTKLSLDLKNVRVEEVFDQIEKNSEFFFLYNKSTIDVDKIVNIKVEGKPISEVLDKLFQNSEISYSIKDRQILLVSKQVNESNTNNKVQQQKSVTGKVKDSSGIPLPGVTVLIKGTTNGTITDGEGNYSLSNVPENATLQFSFVGMKAQEVAVGDKTVINVALAEDAIGIEEVVAIGYGTQRRRDITGSVATVKGETLTEMPSSSVEQTLSGRAAGVQVTQGSGIPGSGASIRVRGVGTVNNAEPLYIVDGIILGNISSGGQTSISPLSMINPNDIESIDILKDASATAIYGSRAGNGVVIITTKKGKSGTMNITFSSYGGVNLLDQNKYNMMSGVEWANYYDKLRTLNNEKSYAGQEFVQAVIRGDEYETWNWLDEATRTGTVQNYDVSLTAGSEKSQMYASLNYFDQLGVMENSDLKRYTIRLNSDHKVHKKLKFGETLTLSRTSSNLVGNLDPFNNTKDYIRRANMENPFKRPYSTDGDYAGTSDFYVPQLDHDNQHILWDLENEYAIRDITRLLASVYGDWEIVKDLNFKTTVSIDWSTAKNENRSPNQKIEGNATTDFDRNSLSFSQSDNQTWFIENTLTYNKTFENHKFTVLGGYQAEEGLYRGFNAGNSYFVNHC